MTSVARVLDLLSPSNFVITVGGTNGKGSSVAFLESILLTAGYTVGAYTSPHLVRYEERVRINGKIAAATALCRVFAEVERARGEVSAGKLVDLSYFEFSTLAALLLFKQQKKPLDFLLLEVGLGGRLDAVNIVGANIAIISTISLDHTAQLGNDRDAIAREKAGIFRADRPAICGDHNPPPAIFECAKNIGARLYCANREFTTKFAEPCYSSWFWRMGADKFNSLPRLHLPIQNAATALAAIKLLPNRFFISFLAIISGLRHAILAGRFQKVRYRERVVILDVAHNPESVEMLAQNLRNNPRKGRTIAVMGALSDKDIASMVRIIADQISVWYVAPVDHPRAAPLSKLLSEVGGCSSVGVRGADSIAKAFESAVAEASVKLDRVVVFGSFYAVAEVLELLE